MSKMPYLTFVPQAKEKDYNLAKQNASWKFDYSDGDISIRSGDLFLFVSGLTYGGDGDPPDGFPLLPSYHGIPLEFGEIRRAEARSKALASDGNEIEISFKSPDVEVSSGNISDDVIEAIRQSVLGKKLVEIDIGTFFDYS